MVPKLSYQPSNKVSQVILAFKLVMKEHKVNKCLLVLNELKFLFEPAKLHLITLLKHSNQSGS